MKKTIKLILFILGLLFLNNIASAAPLSLSVSGGNTQSFYYNENITLTATATFPDECSSTGITWTKSVPGFPFPTIVTIATGPTYNFNNTTADNYTVTANCGASSVVRFVNVSIKNPIVNAGTDNNYSTGDLVNLYGTITGASGCNFDFEWEQISGTAVTIYNPMGNTNNTSFTGHLTFPGTGDELKVKLKVTPQSCYYAGNTYSGTVTYTRGSTVVPSGGAAQASATENEAESIVNNFDLDNNTKLKLSYVEINSEMLNFYWDNIGGQGAIKYYLEYSETSNFIKYNSAESTNPTINFIKQNLNQDNIISYFRLKACYKEKCTNYSNTIKYYSEDYLDLSCKKNKIFVDFEDIYYNYEFLIDKHYSPYSGYKIIKF